MMTQKPVKKILWMTWKDLKNPQAGGAETVNEEIIKRLAKNGYEVILIVAGFDNSKPEEVIDGYRVIRVGSRWSLYWYAYRYYKKNHVGWADLVIDEMNTIPFFTKYYVKEKNIILAHQLCREIWFYQMFFPLNIVGYILEPIYLWLLSDRKVITISESSKNDLIRFGFKKTNISIITPGIETLPLKSLNQIEKQNNFTILSLGSIREMKRPDQQVLAFQIAKKTIPELKMKIAGGGSGPYFEKVMKMISESPYKKDIEYLGRITDEEKYELMQKCHLITVTSVKEGWGLIVTEANSQGAPAVVYDVDGLRDSVRNGVTGLIAKEKTPESLAKEIVKLYKDKKKYSELQKNAWEWSKEINFENCYKKFVEAING